MSIKIGLTGYDGLLGKYLKGRDEIYPIGGDIRDEKVISRQIESKQIDVLIHAAAITSVDRCEQNSKEAFDVNVAGTMNIVNICSAHHIPIIFISTDHVFSGKQVFLPNEHTKPDPINTYGFTKYAGEVVVNTSDWQTIIVRSSKLINGEWLHKNGLTDLLKGNKLDTPKFIYKCFLHASFFADALMRLAKQMNNVDWNLHDILHVTAPIRYSYYELWHQICSADGISADLLIRRTTEYKDGNLAPRPFRGGLDSRKANKLGIIKPIPLIESIKKSLEEYDENYNV